MTKGFKLKLHFTLSENLLIKKKSIPNTFKLRYIKIKLVQKILQLFYLYKETVSRSSYNLI